MFGASRVQEEVVKDIERSASAEWYGNLRGGRGVLRSESGALTEVPYTFATRFESAPGSNPEELLAAAQAACFSMAFADLLSSRGHVPEEVSSRSICHLTPVTGGYRITRMQIQTTVRVAGLDEAALRALAKEAETKCPVANALRPGMQVDVEASLA